ncbi:MAG: hypothetical protein D6755_03815 [Anaerolineae bacterium]|nr:MAG: hypothetical protein D6755_03815 [Anaerolineae bacterium]
MQLSSSRFSTPGWWGFSLLGLLLLWGGMLWVGTRLPVLLSLPVWWPQGSLSLLVDVFSWPYAFGLVTLVLGVLLTAPVRAPHLPALWGTNLPLLFGGMLAVFAGDPLTLALAWALLDAIELTLLLTSLRSSKGRERVVAVFTARLGGILLLLWGAVQGGEHTFVALPRDANVVLLMAVAMRLGVFPLHVPFLRDEPALWRGLGTTLRLVTPLASLGVLAHVARAGVPPQWALPLSTLAWLAGLLGVLGVWTAKSELAARPFWVLACSALAVGAALRAAPSAILAWGSLMLLDGGMLFLADLRERRFLWLPLIAVALLLGLPFTPGWVGAQGYLRPLSAGSLLWMLVHIGLTAGFIRHLWPGRKHRAVTVLERLAYVVGLCLLMAGAWLVGLPWKWWHPLGSGLHLSGFALAGVALWAGKRLDLTRLPEWNAPLASVVRFLSLDWLYGAGWRAYRLLAQSVSFLVLILEDEGGLLWMFFLLLVVVAALSARFPGGLLP